MLLDLPGLAWCPVFFYWTSRAWPGVRFFSTGPPGPGLVSGFFLLNLPGVRFFSTGPPGLLAWCPVFYWTSRPWPGVWFFSTGPPGPGLVSGFSLPGLACGFFYWTSRAVPGVWFFLLYWTSQAAPGLAWCPVSALVEPQRQFRV